MHSETVPAFLPKESACASVLLAQGVPMKQIQEWFGRQQSRHRRGDE